MVSSALSGNGSNTNYRILTALSSGNQIHHHAAQIQRYSLSPPASIVIVTVLWFFLSMIRIVVFMPVSFWGAVLFLLGTIIAIILVFDHFLHFL